MENLRYRFEHGSRALPAQAQLVGVAGSGNLEVLIEAAPLDGACCVEVNTAAVGFGVIWAAVLGDFHQRWQLADVRIAINDVGATPAVVSLRLDQAVESMLGEAP
ncbi:MULTISPECIES: malonate decarboxylase acyl carrier protein [unclassified Janthinobacterium]|uniref:malonate decarboxylase acyl carrier protein n=1 Tax=unclassified Janthinobacterium TaxID=2610881 RepID=UPI000345D65C|nr:MULTISPECIES: malonate decarboxylase acyl carrier protein [unclassified Janthinobacterium]MEC5160495.1 malonate decarboxylase delta subunit [Janthinobacterium sp. CG_S6]